MGCSPFLRWEYAFEMEVVFAKLDSRRYSIEVKRQHGPDLGPQQAPGFDPFLPHEAAHLLVELEARLSDGIFGQLASGGTSIFWPRDRHDQKQYRRQKRKAVTPAEKRAVAVSERLASGCDVHWRRSRGYMQEIPVWWSPELLDGFDSGLIERINARFDQFKSEWSSLAEGQSITVAWPEKVTSRVIT